MQPCIDYRYNQESRACGLLIHENGPRARKACADVLREWRRASHPCGANPERARWFLNHVYYVGYPFKS